MNINGSNHGLVRDHVYLLIIGAMNNVGRTASEEILLCKYYYSKITAFALATTTNI